MTDAEDGPRSAAGISASELVIDASAAAKWLLRDEDDLDAADALLRAYDDGALAESHDDYSLEPAFGHARYR